MMRKAIFLLGFLILASLVWSRYLRTFFYPCANFPYEVSENCKAASTNLGVVTDVKAESYCEKQIVTISYQYSAQGISYSQQESFRTDNGDIAFAKDNIMKNYPKGASVLVHYLLSKPDRSYVLKPSDVDYCPSYKR